MAFMLCQHNNSQELRPVPAKAGITPLAISCIERRTIA
jgi:hypothetical protein